MKRGFIYGLIVLFIVISGFDGHDGKDDELRRIVGEYGQAYVYVPINSVGSLELLSIGFSISNADDKRVEICVSPLTLESFVALGYDYEISQPVVSKSVVSAETLEEAMMWKSYPTYRQYLDIVELLASDYPDICKVDTIGSSINGRKVLALKISDNAGDDENEPEVFYTSTMHGDELGGYVLMLRLAEYLLNNYGTDADVDRLVNSLEIYINPLANPDGTYYRGDTITTPIRYNANSYDLNRNFPLLDGTNSRTMQIETEEMMAFMKSRKFMLSANFHAGVEVVNYPWDIWTIRHADDDWFYNISRQYADTAHAYSLSSYMTYRDNGVTNGHDWYEVEGGRQDYITYFLGGRETTIELDNTKQTPASELDSLWIRNRKSLLDYLGNALYGVVGEVTDSVAGTPLGARVFVLNHDKDSSHVYSDTLTGTYRRMLAPGSYEIQFSSEGYTDKSMTVDLSQWQLINLDVPLVPIGYVPEPEPEPEPESPYSDELELNDLLTVFPNPGTPGTGLKVYIPTGLRGRISLSFYNIAGAKILGYQKTVEEESVMDINAGNLPSGIYLLVVVNETTGQSAVTRIMIID